MMKPNEFFTPISNTKPFFKAAFQGFAGTGKTYTAALVARGLHQKIKSTKPVIIFDTEKAAKFLKPIFAEAGIEVLVKESRSLADLKETMKLMRDGFSDILIIDSISHVWENFLEAYKQKVRRNALQFQDWGQIKPTWKAEFSDPYVRDPYHIMMCGRAGYEYANEINEETGKREIYQSGVKMKVEGETAYEPDLLVQMERYQEMEGGNVKRVVRTATVLKDRSTILDGKSFENPTFANFEPAVEAMMADPSSHKIMEEGNAGLLFRTEEEKWEWKKNRDRWLEEIQNLLTSVAPGQTSTEKKFKVDILFETFGTTSWVAIQDLHPDDIKAGYERIRENLLAKGVIAFKEDGLVANKIEAKNDAKVDAEVKETIKKSPAKAKVKKEPASAGASA